MELLNVEREAVSDRATKELHTLKQRLDLAHEENTRVAKELALAVKRAAKAEASADAQVNALRQEVAVRIDGMEQEMQRNQDAAQRAADQRVDEILELQAAVAAQAEAMNSVMDFEVAALRDQTESSIAAANEAAQQAADRARAAGSDARERVEAAEAAIAAANAVAEADKKKLAAEYEAAIAELRSVAAAEAHALEMKAQSAQRFAGAAIDACAQLEEKLKERTGKGGAPNEAEADFGGDMWRAGGGRLIVGTERCGKRMNELLSRGPSGKCRERSTTAGCAWDGATRPKTIWDDVKAPGVSPKTRREMAKGEESEDSEGSEDYQPMEPY
eukprot:PRCOL_00005196-RA